MVTDGGRENEVLERAPGVGRGEGPGRIAVSDPDPPRSPPLSHSTSQPSCPAPGYAVRVFGVTRKQLAVAGLELRELSAEAKRRLKWFDWHREHGQNVSKGIHLFSLPPRSPKLNGRVERANRTYTVRSSTTALLPPPPSLASRPTSVAGNTPTTTSALTSPSPTSPPPSSFKPGPNLLRRICHARPEPVQHIDQCLKTLYHPARNGGAAS